MHDRIFAPAGMNGARIAADPRGLVDDYATGNGFDLRPRVDDAAVRRRSGATPRPAARLASLKDMAAWVRLQLRQGLRRSPVAGSCPPPTSPSAGHRTSRRPWPRSSTRTRSRVGYGMGWLRQEYRDGTSLVWHNGAIDGFTTYMGFLPQHDLGLVVLNNMTSGPTGTFWYTYVLNLLLSQRFGLNVGVPGQGPGRERPVARASSPTSAKDAKPVDLAAVAPVPRVLRGRLLARPRGPRPAAADRAPRVPAPGHAGRDLRDVRRVHGRGRGQARAGARRHPPRRDRRSRDGAAEHRMTGTAAPAIDWSTFDHHVQAGFDRMRLVGAAVAVVSSTQILHTLTLGSRTRAPRRPVTATTRFVVASTTKAMSSALVAGYVDDGVVGWDQKAVDAWPGFRAPTDELTRSLTIRDLLGMATGITAPDSTDLHLGAYTPAEMLQSLVNLPVTSPPRTSFFS